MKRQFVSLLIFFISIVLIISGVLSFFTEYTRVIATVHTIFGLLFIIIVLEHLFNNAKVLIKYFRSWMWVPIACSIGIMIYLAMSDVNFINKFIDYGAKSKANYGVKLASENFTEIQMSLDKNIKLDIKLFRAEHFWHPQIAVWIEDTLGNYLETLYVTKATAKGIFSGGKTKENFKALDAMNASNEDSYRRVNALPV